MHNVKLQIYHPTLNVVSDRTFRALLKKLSTLGREIQTQEVYQFVRDCEFPQNIEQSLRDRMKAELNHITAYYVEDVRRGSLELLVMLSAFGLFILQKTLGKTLEEAWQRTETHRKLLDYLSSDRRKKVLEHNIDLVTNNWNLDGFEVRNTSVKTDRKQDLLVRIDLETPSWRADEIKAKPEKVDTEYLERYVRHKMAEDGGAPALESISSRRVKKKKVGGNPRNKK